MSFQRALQRAAKANPAWIHCSVYRQDPSGLWQNVGGWRYSEVAATKCVLDYRPHDDRAGLGTGTASHRAIILIESIGMTDDFIRCGDRWFSVQRFVGADAMGATVTVDVNEHEPLI